MRFATRAIHEGQAADPATGATIVPIYQTSTFTQAGPGEHHGWEYSRSGNPTRAALETCLASLEEGRRGFAFASGLAAETAVLSLLHPGEHVVAAADLYGGTVRLFDHVFAPLGIGFSYVDATGPESLANALRPETRMVWVETPSNPLMRLTDIAAAAALTRARDSLLVVDNTFASPFCQHPLALGADVVVHSTTKYVGGHSDVVGGAVIVRDEDLGSRIAFLANATGGVQGAFDAWLTLRGLKTLPLRMRQHAANATAVAQLLERHPLAEEVFYPGLPSHPDHELVRTQMGGFGGGIVTFRIAGGFAAAVAFLRALRVFSLAESLGGVESLASHPATMTHASVPEAQRLERGITPGLVRLSVGVEDVEDLLADVTQGLDAASAAARRDRH